MQGLLLLVGLLGIVWGLSNWIVTGSDSVLIMGGMSIALVIIVVTTLNDWRKGVFFFILWLLFEDLARKYLGNGLILFFGKDVLAAITYLSLWRARVARRSCLVQAAIHWCRWPCSFPWPSFKYSIHGPRACSMVFLA